MAKPDTRCAKCPKEASSDKTRMKYCLFLLLLPLPFISKGQTYSKVLPDSEIIAFITQDIANDSIKTVKTIRRKIFKLTLNEFYYRDSSDFNKKNENLQFIFKYHKYSDREYTNNLDTVFSRKDIDFFYSQIKGQTSRINWKIAFPNSILVDNVELDEAHYAKTTMYSYSLPLFSADKSKAIIIKAFYCGLLCGGGAYYLYQKDKAANWKLIRVMNEWGE